MGEQLAGQVAIVTGAGQGIGRAIALALARAGARVVVTDLNPETAAAVAAEIVALPREALAVQVDVADPAAAARMVKAALEHFGQVDVLVNNAGCVAYKKFTELGLADWDRDIAVNLNGTYYCCRALVPHLIERRRGRIINISSAAAQLGEAYTAAYSAAKAGVNALTRVLARELGRYGITANSICPGMVETPILKQTFFGSLSEEKMAQMIKVSYPLGRIGQPEDIADAVVFLASDAARYITGQTLNVDGGYVMNG